MSIPAPVIPLVSKDEFRLIPLAELCESPTNPRKHFHAKALEELTESVRQQGVVQPIVVRLSQANGRADVYEIVTGARRFRASKAAGRDTVPAIVRQLGDTQVIEIQMIENLQREDIHPLDEAHGYQTLIDQTGMEVVAIAAKVGKSESYIYQRLKLLALSAKAQKAFLADKISAGHAILIARLQPQDQAEALNDCLRHDTSVRMLIDWINRHVYLDLQSAPFAKDDAQLLPEAGSCVDCPKRTGFQPALFPDIAKKDTCTDRRCFDAKLDVLLKTRAEQITQEQEGAKPLLITTDYLQHPGDKPKALVRDKWIKAAADSCAHTRAALFVDGNDIGKFITVCAEPTCKVHFNTRYNQPKHQPTSSERTASRKLEAGKQAREQTIAAVAQDTSRLETVDLKLLAEAFLTEMWHEQIKALFKARGWEPKKKDHSADYRSVAHTRIEAMTPREVAGLLMECTLRSRLCQENDDLARIAKQSGVDFYKIERKALEALTERERQQRQRQKERAAETKTGAKKVQTSAKAKGKK